MHKCTRNDELLLKHLDDLYYLRDGLQTEKCLSSIIYFLKEKQKDVLSFHSQLTSYLHVLFFNLGRLISSIRWSWMCLLMCYIAYLQWYPGWLSPGLRLRKWPDHCWEQAWDKNKQHPEDPPTGIHLPPWTNFQVIDKTASPANLTPTPNPNIPALNMMRMSWVEGYQLCENKTSAWRSTYTDISFIYDIV